MEIKVSDLPTANTSTFSDILLILQNGINKKLSVTTLLKNLNSADDIKVNPLQNAISTNFSSKNITNLLHLSGVSDRIGVGTNNLSSSLVTVAGSVSVGSSTTQGVITTSSEEINWNSGNPTKALSVVVENSYLIVQNSFSGVFSLSNGVDGQTKKIVLVTPSSGNTTIACSGISSSFSSINLSAIGHSVSLVYKGFGASQGWAVVGYNGATFSV